jgi:hypothetical protein
MSTARLGRFVRSHGEQTIFRLDGCQHRVQQRNKGDRITIGNLFRNESTQRLRQVVPDYSNRDLECLMMIVGRRRRRGIPNGIVASENVITTVLLS